MVSSSGVNGAADIDSNANGYDTSGCYTTLLTNRAYFGGLLVLDHTLRKHRSKYQLVVMVTQDVEKDTEYMEAFKAAGIPTIVVDPIEPAPRDGKVNKGTWEKLAPWGPKFFGYKVSTIMLHDINHQLTCFASARRAFGQ